MKFFQPGENEALVKNIHTYLCGAMEIVGLAVQEMFLALVFLRDVDMKFK